MCNIYQSLLRGNLMNSVEKPNVFTDLAALLEFNLLIIFGTGLLLGTTQNLLISLKNLIIVALDMPVKTRLM